MSATESVTVQSSGVVTASPDVRRVDLGLEARDSTVDAALDGSNRGMRALERVLLDAGVVAEDGPLLQQARRVVVAVTVEWALD